MKPPETDADLEATPVPITPTHPDVEPRQEQEDAPNEQL